MKISISGHGYVATMTAGCLTFSGHGIVGTDVPAQKVELFDRRIPPVIEQNLIRHIVDMGQTAISILGFFFKSDTDDLRNSAYEGLGW